MLENFDIDESSFDASDVNMLVSPICSKDGEKYAFVSFEYENKTAEAKIPSCEIISNKGFTDEEISQLIEYMRQHITELKEMSAGINIFENMYGKNA